MGRPKLTEEMVAQAIKLKGDGLSNGDIICALGVHHSTFYSEGVFAGAGVSAAD